MLGIFIFILLAAIIFGVVLFATLCYSIWIPVGIYVITMIVLFLCIRYSVGYVGGSDAMGNGMEKGFLMMFYSISMILASITFFVLLLIWYFKYR